MLRGLVGGYSISSVIQQNVISVNICNGTRDCIVLSMAFYLGPDTYEYNTEAPSAEVASTDVQIVD